MHAMEVTLVYRSGSLEGRKQKFDKDIIRIGRKPDNHVVLHENVVSSYHAEVRRKGSDCVLIDLESTNGSFVNGKRVVQARLHFGDKIQIGAEGPVLEFRSGARPEKDLPKIVPISGAWESGNGPIELNPDQTTLGRGQHNDVVVGRGQGSVVSTEHAVIRFESGNCVLEDLNSTNGTYVNGKRIRTARLQHGDQVELGAGGPVFEFGWKGRTHREKGRTAESDRIFCKLERAARGGPAGERTMMMLRAADRYYKRRRWPLLAASIVVVIVAVLVAALYYQEKKRNERLMRLAADVFYQARALDAELVRLRQRDTFSAEFQSANDRKRRLQQEYDRYLESLGLYKGKSPVEQVVMRMARNLGETDLEVPPDFHRLAMAYVDKWRSTPRLRTALDRARERRLLEKIRKALEQRGLPEEFLFIALRESGFDATVVGPPTSYGFAKGLWQFIPPTATEYGLTLGPLKDQPIFDPSDERHNEERSTDAAVRYLAFLYSTKAAASGLLVIASYNYGETRIIKKLDELPNDPRERSFWNFYKNNWLPAETREYVMYVFAGALICEKPDLFNIAMPPCR